MEGSVNLHSYRIDSPDETRRVRREIVAEHREFVRRVVRSVVPAQYEREAMQVGLAGVLIGLDQYDPAGDESFASTIERIVRREIQSWMTATS